MLRGHLPHARVLGARIGVDGLQQFHFGVEGRLAERVFVAVKLAVGAAGRLGIFAAVAALDGAHCFGGAAERAFGQVGGMGIADRLVLDRAQAETLRGVVGSLLEPAVVEHQRLGLAIFQEQFAVVGAFQPVRDGLSHRAAVEPGAIDQGGNGWVHGYFSGWASATP